MELSVHLERADRDIVLQGEPMARGGEAVIFPLPTAPELLAKIYHKAMPEHAEKLAAMIANPPEDPMLAKGHVSIAWPTERIFSTDPERRFLGYVMRRVEKARPIIEFYNPRSRMQLCPQFNYSYLLRTARNLAAAFRALHDRGYVIGDVNESNILTTAQALVTMVDTDSFQVRVGNTTHRCRVGKMEYTPPELQGSRFAEVDRTPTHDLFGLGVLIFQLLMQGNHPFAGKFEGAGDPPGVGKCISQGYWPYSKNKLIPYVPGPLVPPFDVLPLPIQDAMRRCFEDGQKEPTARPEAAIWQRALQDSERNLSSCSLNPQHVFHNGLKTCPWCEITKRFQRDPFPMRTQVQTNTKVNGKGGKTSVPEEILDVLPADPVLPIPPVPRSVVIEVRPITLPETLPVVEVLPVNASNKSKSGEGLPGPSTSRRTKLNTQTIAPPEKEPASSSHWLTWFISIFIGLIVLAVVLFFVLKGKKTPKEEGVYRGHSAGVNSVAVSSDHQFALSASDDGTVRYWDIFREKEIHAFTDHKAPLHCVLFSRDGKNAFSGGRDNNIIQWDLDGKKMVGQPFRGHTDAVTCLALSSDGWQLLSGSADQTVRIWDIKTQKTLDFTARSGDPVSSVAYSRDGKKVVAAAGTQILQFDIVDGGVGRPRLQEITRLRGHTEIVTGVAFSYDGARIYSGSLDKSIREWDLATRFERRKIGEHPAGVNSLVISTDGNRLLTAGNDRSVILWDVRTAQTVGSFSLHNDKVLSAVFSPDGEFAISGSADKTLRKWKFPEGK